MTFETFGIKPELLKSLKEMGIVEPTLIQKDAIPLIKEGRDVIGKSKTGSGKTAAFAIPILEKIIPGKESQALILAPTRELAVQIAKEIEAIAKYTSISVVTVYGGVSYNPQINGLKKCEIIVATPGRMADHIEKRHVDISKLSFFVLDEADKMSNMGFLEDISYILDHTPQSQQMLLFSATISKDVNFLRDNYMTNSAELEAEEFVEEDLLKQYYYNVSPHEKFSFLVHLLEKEETGQVLIFCSKRSTVELVAKNLRTNGVKADCIHGKLSQHKRLQIIENYNKGRQKVLVASAVAARGIHVDGVTHVFNYDLSQDPEEYIHRIGRTARAGDSGKAITLLSNNDHDIFSAIHHNYDVKIELLPLDKFKRLNFDAGQRRNPTRGGPRGDSRGGSRGGGRYNRR
jgi:ATP-dependent RNA helicase RhlE